MTHRIFIALALLFAPSTYALTPEEVYELHHRLSKEGDFASPLYGYCAFKTGLIKNICAFAPDETWLGKLTRQLFFIQPWDGEMVLTAISSSIVPQITPELWGTIVTILADPKETNKIALIEKLLTKTLDWEQQVTAVKKNTRMIRRKDSKYAELDKQSKELKEKLQLKPTTDDERKKHQEQAKQLENVKLELKKRLANLPREIQEELKRALRNKNAPKLLAEALVGAVDERLSIDSDNNNNNNNTPQLWPKDLAYTIIGAFISQKFQYDAVRIFINALPKKYLADQKSETLRFEKIPTKNITPEIFEKDPALALLNGFQSAIIAEVPYIKNVPYGEVDLQTNKRSELSDCAETALLNLINILFYDSKIKAVSFELHQKNLQEIVSINPKVVNFYKKYGTPESQRSIKAHEDWLEIVSRVPGLNYLRPEQQYELDPQRDNFLQAIDYLIFYNPKEETPTAEKILEKLNTVVKNLNGTIEKNDAKNQLTINIPDITAVLETGNIHATCSIQSLKNQYNQLPKITREAFIKDSYVYPILIPLEEESLLIASFQVNSNKAISVIAINLKDYKNVLALSKIKNVPYLTEILWKKVFSDPDIRDNGALHQRLDLILRGFLFNNCGTQFLNFLLEIIDGKSIISEYFRTTRNLSLYTLDLLTRTLLKKRISLNQKNYIISQAEIAIEHIIEGILKASGRNNITSFIVGTEMLSDTIAKTLKPTLLRKLYLYSSIFVSQEFKKYPNLFLAFDKKKRIALNTDTEPILQKIVSAENNSLRALRSEILTQHSFENAIAVALKAFDTKWAHVSDTTFDNFLNSVALGLTALIDKDSYKKLGLDDELLDAILNPTPSLQPIETTLPSLTSLKKIVAQTEAQQYGKKKQMHAQLAQEDAEVTAELD